jgi:hypothetical protein
MKKKLAIAFLVVIYVMASGLTYVTFRKYPDHSGAAALQWLLFYIATAVYPPIWTFQNLRLLQKMGLDQSQPLRRHAWAPFIVGGTALLTGLGLLSPLLR